MDIEALRKAKNEAAICLSLARIKEDELVARLDIIVSQEKKDLDKVKKETRDLWLVWNFAFHDLYKAIKEEES